jgi:predicted amino acid dehydrogenase
MGEGAAGVVPELTAALKEADCDLKVAAATILGAVGPKAASAVCALKEAQASQEQLLSQAAARALERVCAGTPAP